MEEETKFMKMVYFLRMHTLIRWLIELATIFIPGFIAFLWGIIAFFKNGNSVLGIVLLGGAWLYVIVGMSFYEDFFFLMRFCSKCGRDNVKKMSHKYTHSSYDYDVSDLYEHNFEDTYRCENCGNQWVEQRSYSSPNSKPDETL